MQLWSWLLAVCLAVAVSARPEARPEVRPEVRPPTLTEDGGGLNALQDTQPLPAKGANLEQPKDTTLAGMTPLPAIDDVKKEDEAMKPLPVPIEPDVMVPDDSKVFPEGSLRSPTLAAEATADRVFGGKAALVPNISPELLAQQENKEKKKAGRVARTYLPAEARGAENDGLELNLAPDTLLVPYYGGAKGQYLIIAKPVTAADLKKTKKKKKKPARPGNKEEEEEEEENVGEETNEKPQPPPDNSDTVTIAQPPPNASMAEARPVAIAVAGEGGVASARPVGTAVVGPGGLAVSRPIGTAIAGIQGAEFLVTGAGQPQPQLGPNPFVYPLGPPVASPLGAPIPPGYVVSPHPATYLSYPSHPPYLSPQWLVYPPPPPYPFF